MTQLEKIAGEKEEITFTFQCGCHLCTFLYNCDPVQEEHERYFSAECNVMSGKMLHNNHQPLHHVTLAI